MEDGSEPEDIVDDTEDADGKDTPDELLEVEDDEDVALVQLHTFDDDAMDSADDKEAAYESDTDGRFRAGRGRGGSYNSRKR